MSLTWDGLESGGVVRTFLELEAGASSGDGALNATVLDTSTPQCIGWIVENFGDCIYTKWEIVSFIAGNISLLCFLVAFIPQLYKNYRRRSVDGLSAQLLIGWGCGDVFGFAGTLLTPQFFSQRAIAAYFLVVDVVVLVQYIFYKCYAGGKGGAGTSPGDSKDGGGLPADPKQWEAKQLLDPVHIHVVEDEGEVDHLVRGTHGSQETVYVPSRNPSTTNHSRRGTTAPALPSPAGMPVMASLSILALATLAAALPSADEEPSPTQLLMGSIMAWISGLFYFYARIPQIIVNYKTKSVAGLSLIVFAFTILGNMMYGISICLRVPEINAAFFETKLPYLVGSVLTLVFDIIIFIQGYMYGGMF